MRFYIVCLLLLHVSHPVFAARETGNILGRVDLDGQSIPGVTVTITSSSLIGGKLSVVTDIDGQYRFMSIPPGTYSVKAELAGFQPVVREEIRLFVGTSITADLTLTASASETILVAAETPFVDVTSAATPQIVPLETIENLPKRTSFMGPFELATLTPGVGDDFVAYGAAGFTGTAYWIDGVDISNPACGCPYLIPNYNWVQEVDVIGVGAPVEYSEFSGVIVNSVTRSGGNNFHGLAEVFFQNDSLTASNVGDTGLTEPKVNQFADTTLQLGGPILQDKLWFFTGFEVTNSEEQPSRSIPTSQSSDEYKVIAKFTSKLNENNTLQGFGEGQYFHSPDNLFGIPSVLPEAAWDEKIPTVAWNLSLVSILGNETLLDAKFGGFRASDDAKPLNGQAPGHFDGATQQYSVNAPVTYLSDRTRAQASASISHYARDFIHGDHDFKFGVEYQYSSAQTRYYYTGGILYYDYASAPYYRYLWDGYDFDGRLNRFSAFAQDNWNVADKINLDVGIRWNHNSGSLVDQGTVFRTDPVALRLGATYDLWGDHKSVIKVHYGHYHEALFTSYFEHLDYIADFFIEVFDPATGQWLPVARTPRQADGLADDINHPYVEQFTAGLDQQLPGDFAFGAHYIYRDWEDLMEDVNVTGVYEGVPFLNPVTGEIITVFNQLNPGEDVFVLKNAPARRRYDAFEVFTNKRFGSKLYLSGSLVLSRTEGNFSNTTLSNDGTTPLFNDPNFSINGDGRLTNDPTVEVKLQGTYSLPWGINTAAYFRHVSGDTWTPQVRVRGLNQGPVLILALPRGSNRLPSRNVLDVRLEKEFPIKQGHLLFTVDVYNLFNTGYPLRVQDVFGSSVFGQPVFFSRPREARIGIRYSF